MESHLLQMRGLKHIGVHCTRCAGTVASFTDAWIETKSPVSRNVTRFVASFTDAWIETGALPNVCTLMYSRIFYRCVD